MTLLPILHGPDIGNARAITLPPPAAPPASAASPPVRNARAIRFSDDTDMAFSDGTIIEWSQ